MTTLAVIIGIARFGPYEADVRSGEVRKLGTRIKLGEQTLRIVVLVMDRPGELVTREELCTGRWSDDTLRIDHGLNSAVQRFAREPIGHGREGTVDRDGAAARLSLRGKSSGPSQTIQLPQLQPKSRRSFHRSRVPT